MYLVEGRPVDLVGALVRRRATTILVGSLALGRQGSRRMYLQAAAQLHLVLLVSLRRAKLQNQQHLHQAKHPVFSAVRVALGPSLLAI